MTSKECRLCLRHEANCVSLFAKRRGTKLAEIVRFCARVEISEDDGLPGDACPRCVDEALNAYLFVNKCRRSDAELRTEQAFAKDGFDDDATSENPTNTEQKPVVEASSESAPKSTEEPEEALADMPEDASKFSPVAQQVEHVESESCEVQVKLDIELPSVHNEPVDELECVQTEDEFVTTEEEAEMIAEPSDATVCIKQEELNEVSAAEGEEEEVDFFVEYLDENSESVASPNNDETMVDDQYEDEDGVEMEVQETVSVTSTTRIYHCCGVRCRASFNTAEELDEHSIQVHLPCREPASSQKSFECQRCFARFSTEKSLALHTRRLNDCPFCQETFAKFKEKQVHMLQVHGESMPVTASNSEERICCGCHETFASEAELRAHSESQHALRKGATDETRSLQCTVCYKLFRTVESLRIHQRFVYRPKNFVCDTCGQAFDTRSKLMTHEIVHTDQRDFQCDKCDKSFKKIHALRSHQLLHEEKKEVCRECGLRFHRKSNLKMHMRKHQDTFFYACPDCPKQFKNNSHLKEHYKVHSKEKPYQCSFCERTFSYYSDRKRHEMSHTGAYPFECGSCAKKFARKTLLDKHSQVCLERSSMQELTE
ncbi:zinc finger protein 239-like [Culex pipiens pallens]|uniref:zinc finger protein 239-like n=1 Tax=Culex pipiens pallens TaxID=42434 RepID=UPI001953BFC9|nr:zinc finger protein 239-like [Culex pipiens pallens]